MTYYGRPLAILHTVFAFIALCTFGGDLVLAKNPNIVIILVDDMGYGDLKCFNPDSKIETPSINQLAKEGMRFTDAHAPGPLCHMSRYGLMTGRYPFRTNVGVWPKKAVIQKERVTIASLLKAQGYSTSMVGKWHLGFDENGYDNPLPGGPVDVGFDSFFGIRASTDIPPYFYIRDRKAVMPPTDRIEANFSQDGWNQIQGAFWRAGGISPDLALKDVLPKFTDEAINVIKHHSKQHQNADSKKPLFLYLAYPAPHTPWLPSKEFAGKSKAGMYGDFASMVDSMVGKVLKSLDETGMAKETLVIFSSDNGPVWYEKDIKKYGHDSVGGLRGMKADAWEGGHRMPLIVRWPGKVRSQTTSESLVCFTDLLATFAELTETKLGVGQGPDSVSFLSSLNSEMGKTKPRKSIVMKSGNGTMMVRSGDWKLIDKNLGSGGFSKPNRIKPVEGGPKGQLYNLKEDRGEKQNRWNDDPERVQQMRRLMKQIVDEDQ